MGPRLSEKRGGPYPFARYPGDRFSGRTAARNDAASPRRALSIVACQLDRPDEITVLALGKFGGHELLYGADLDVVFIGNDVSAGEQLIQAMGAKTAEGAVFPLDGRLRPEGEKGVLVTPLSAYREYFDHRAQFWEAQALTKARAVYGPESQPLNARGRRNLEPLERPRRPEDGNSGKCIDESSKNEPKGTILSHFKTGKGGLIGIEFLVQYLQMKHQIQETNTLPRNRKTDRCSGSDESVILRTTYGFLRRIESVLRRVSNSSISQLPSNAEELRVLAIRMGFAEKENFWRNTPPGAPG